MNFIEADRLCWPRAGGERQPARSFSVGAGLTVVRGGEGRGKSTLLRLMAGLAEPASGVIRRLAASTFMPDCADHAHDAVSAAAYLATVQQGLPDWDAAIQSAVAEGFGLSEHIDKPMFMLSTGSRRKVGLVAAAAGKAQLTLLDTPYAALDARARNLLTRRLEEAAHDRQRAWVVADYELPPGLAGGCLAGLIDLGD
jgi:ABC-type transport system involved in cytochrome c biogenesis ATPase subunit